MKHKNRAQKDSGTYRILLYDGGRKQISQKKGFPI